MQIFFHRHSGHDHSCNYQVVKNVLANQIDGKLKPSGEQELIKWAVVMSATGR